MTTRARPKSSLGQRITPLDGMRGIGIILVVLTHWLVPARESGNPVARGITTVFNGDMGLLAFFVLSGYLITGLMVRERQRTGRISLPAFYLRRSLRIFPPFYFFLIVMAIVAATGTISISWQQFASSGLYVWNYSPAAEGWWLGHTWSLAVEEQFYLLWPALLVLIGSRKAVNIAVAYIVAAPVVRVANYVLLPESREQIDIMFHTRADSLLIGCVLALLPTVYPDVWKRVSQVVARPSAVILALIALLCSNIIQGFFGGAWMLPVGFSVSNVAMAILVATVVVVPNGRLSRALCSRPLVLLGMMSYSLYLWQQPLLYHGPDQPFFARQWWALPALLIVGTFSYLCIEKPASRLKARLTRREATAGESGTSAAGGAEGQRRLP